MNYEDIDVDNLANGSESGCIPNVDFFMQFKEMGSVTGHVDDVAGKPIPSIRIELSDTRLFTETNEYGDYTFTHLKAGNYTVKAVAPTEFESSEANTEVTAGEDSKVNLIMIPKMKAALSGKVTRVDNGNSIEGATVTLGGPSSHSTQTDTEGAYMIQGLYADYENTMTVKCAGFTTYSSKINIADETTVKDVQLDEKPLPA